jgi:hypothetical protein
MGRMEGLMLIWDCRCRIADFGFQYDWLNCSEFPIEDKLLIR